MFNNVLQCLVSRATIGIASGIGDNSAEIGNDAAGIVDITAKVIQC